jgi:hypothetical protein
MKSFDLRLQNSRPSARSSIAAVGQADHCHAVILLPPASSRLPRDVSWLKFQVCLL